MLNSLVGRLPLLFLGTSLSVADRMILVTFHPCGLSNIRLAWTTLALFAPFFFLASAVVSFGCRGGHGGLFVYNRFVLVGIAGTTVIPLCWKGPAIQNVNGGSQVVRW